VASVKDSWLPLRLLTLLVFVLVCAIMVFFAWDLSDAVKLYVNAGLLAGALAFGLLGIFLRPRKKEGRLSYLSNRTFGLISVGLVVLMIIINPYNFFRLTLGLNWPKYLGIIFLIFLQATLILVYLELLWALASFQEEPYPDEGDKAHRLRLINQLHYLIFLPLLVFFCAIFVAVVAIFTTFFVFTSRPAFLHSMASGSVYPFFIIGMIALLAMLVLLGMMYLWYRFMKTEPELFLEEKKPAVDFSK
jgi:hypothetical protein